MPTKATMARKTPTSRTSRLERFKLVLPDEIWCDRWHHSSTASEPRDYTKGLGPLGGNGRKSSVSQGTLQGWGVAGAPRTGRADTVHRADRRKPAGRWSGGPCFECLARQVPSDRVADVAEQAAHRATEKNECDDRDDGDEREDECVFREALPVVGRSSECDRIERIDDRVQSVRYLLSARLSERRFAATSSVRTGPECDQSDARRDTNTRPQSLDFSGR